MKPSAYISPAEEVGNTIDNLSKALRRWPADTVLRALARHADIFIGRVVYEVPEGVELEQWLRENYSDLGQPSRLHECRQIPRPECRRPRRASAIPNMK